MTAREPLDLAAIEARANAATDGPWEADEWEIYVAGAGTAGWVAETHLSTDEDQARANARFIADARTTVPRLVADLRAVRAEVTSRPTPLDWDALRAKRDRLRELVVKRERQVEQLRTERDQARAEVERLTAQLAAQADAALAAGWNAEADRLAAELGEATVRAAVAGGPTVHVDPVLPERTAVPGEPLPPIPDSAYPPSAVSLVLGVPDVADREAAEQLPTVGRWPAAGLDSPEAVDRELRRVAAELGEPYEVVRDLYDAMVACGEEHLIERDQHELDQTEFVTSDHDGKRWWVLRGPSGAISLTAAVVPADAKLPRLSTAMMVRDRDGSALFPDCFTAHRAGTATCPALPGGCDADGEAISGAAKALESWAATGNDDDVIRDALVDVYRRELLGGAR